MSRVDRPALYKPGATFFKEGDTVWFQFQADASSVIGPVKATEQHKKDHAAEWELYTREAFNGAPLEAFDHDDSGNPGGAAPPLEKPKPAPRKRGRPKKVL